MSNTVNNYTETDLGNISFNPRGEYDSSVEYEYLDAVSYQGGSYFCLAELETTITGIAPDAGRDSEHWQMIAAPGDMTPEYTAAYNDVINKAVQVETSRAAVEIAQQEIEAVQTDVQQLHSDTVQMAQQVENSKNSAANSAQSAEQSRKTVSESEQNINGQITGFDSRVSEVVEQSKEEINTTKQQAIYTITNQQDTSVNIVKTEGEKIITRVENDAKTVADDRATVEEATQTVLNNAQEVAQNTQTVASNTEKAAASAEGAKTSADNAAQSAKSVGDASKQIEQNKKDVDSLKKDKVNLPIDDEGNIQNGNSGQILETNGDGTTQWVDKPEGIKDGSVSPVKTTFMNESYVESTPLFYATGKYWALKSSNASYYHSWNKNYNLIDRVVEGTYVFITATSSYLNYRFMNANPAEMTDAATLKAAVVSYGGTYDGYTNLNNTDTNTPTLHHFTLQVPEGATYFIVDFGYTSPTNLIYGYFDENYHLCDNGVWESSIKDGAVTNKKIGNLEVTEEKLAEAAVAASKIIDNAVTARKLNIGYVNNISTRTDNPNVIKVGTGWESYVSIIRAGDVYPDGVMWAYHCEAGKYYRIVSAMTSGSEYSSLFTQPNPNNVSNVNLNGFICSSLIEPKAGDFSAQQDYLAGAWIMGLPQVLEPDYATIYNNTKTNYARNVFRCNKDFWMYWCTATDVSDTAPYIACTRVIQECSAPSDTVIKGNSWNSTSIGTDIQWKVRYIPELTGISVYKEDIALDTINGIEKYNIEPAIAYALAKANRDPADNNVRVMIVGDSIAYAASNAGLQNAWRKYISTRLNLYETAVLAVSGTGIIKGAPYDWFGNAKTNENYLEDYSGYNGIVHWCKNILGEETDYHDTWFSGISMEESARRFEKLSIAIIALGTNDWSNNGVLGSADTLDDETTFYGAVQKTYSYLHDMLGIPAVLFVAPFKRAGWDTNNSAVEPYTIYDMCHALCEIACVNPDMYVLDCIDRWYLNYDNPTIRNKSFIGNVHIKGYAHHMFTNDLAREIRNILSAKGVV